MKTTTTPLAPLPTDKQIDELLNLLDEHCSSDGDTGMNISMLDGYLTAIVSGPETIPTHEWLPPIFGATEDIMQRLFADEPEQAERIKATIFGRFNGIGSLLRENRLSPIILEGEIDLWCLGYVRGMGLRQDAWGLLLEDEEYAHILAPIMLASISYAMAKEGIPAAQAIFQNEPLAQEYLREVSRAALTAHRFWQGKPLTHTATATLKKPIQPGRNEPCLCGSGKKHKKCCGAT